VSFAFTLSSPARLTVSLARWTRAHARGRWRPVLRPFTFTAAQGRERARLSARGGLPPGRYRLTLTPAAGRPAAIVFRIA
ncbi:MAG TPA: hypothetical protein VNZ05_10165, partial [Solirubrobacteraceae bacterium]|nr:hypothetical protein [Solirubrobacteraceae bacterium]